MVRLVRRLPAVARRMWHFSSELRVARGSVTAQSECPNPALAGNPGSDDLGRSARLSEATPVLDQTQAAASMARRISTLGALIRRGLGQREGATQAPGGVRAGGASPNESSAGAS
jgi:hypothetical protein